jgi:hypothetical protein
VVVGCHTRTLLVVIHLHRWLPYTYIVGCHTLTLLVAIHLHPLPFVQRRAQVGFGVEVGGRVQAWHLNGISDDPETQFQPARPDLARPGLSRLY